MFTRRAFLQTLGLGTLAFFSLGGYAFAVEPRFRLTVKPYRLMPPGWPVGGSPLRMAVIADIHACDPWMPLSRVEEIVAVTNGDEAGHRRAARRFRCRRLKSFRTAIVPSADWAAALGKLKAPLGVHAILGNHDWWTDAPRVRHVLTANAIR